MYDPVTDMHADLSGTGVSDLIPAVGIGWGDGSPVEEVAVSEAMGNIEHQYPAAGIYSVIIEARFVAGDWFGVGNPTVTWPLTVSA